MTLFGKYNYKSVVFSFTLALSTSLLAVATYEFWMGILVDYLPMVHGRTIISPFFRLHFSFIFIFPILFYLTFLIWHEHIKRLIMFSAVNSLGVIISIIAYTMHLKTQFLKKIAQGFEVNASEIDIEKAMWVALFLMIILNFRLQGEWKLWNGVQHHLRRG